MPQIRVLMCARTIEHLIPQISFMDHNGPPRFLMSSFKSWITFLHSQLISLPKINYIAEKSIVVNLQSNFIIFGPYQHMNSNMSFGQVWITIPQEI